jgi:dihydroorotate dehydrogenase
LPIGIPASPLTVNSSWLEFHARNGFNVLTYKTVRNRVEVPYPWPNWVFLEIARTAHEATFADGAFPDILVDEPLPLDTEKLVGYGHERSWPSNPRAFSMANSFGVPSREPGDWMADVRKASDILATDQVLIVSVMGDYPNEWRRLSDIVSDFALVAVRAEQAGGSVIELNLSCPNSLDVRSKRVGEDLLGEDPVSTKAVVEEVAKALQPDTKLIIKLSYLSHTHLREVVTPVLEHIDGIAGVNTRQWEVRRPDGTSLFPRPPDASEDARLRAGVSGIAIQNFGLDFVESCAALRAETGSTFAILGMGGVMTAVDAKRFIEAGADAVQSASAAFFNPHLAAEVHQHFGESLASPGPVRLSPFLRTLVLSAIEAYGRIDEFDLAAHTGLGLEELATTIDQLIADSSVRRSEYEDVSVYTVASSRRRSRSA